MAPGHRLGAARAYCFGRATSAPSILAACQPQWGLSSMARASATMSALLSATIASARLGVAIRPTTRVVISRLAFHLLRKGDVHIRCHVRARVRAHATRGNADEVETCVLERAGKHDRMFRREAAFDPVVAGDAGAQWHSFRNGGPHRLHHFQWKAHARFKRAT